MNYRAMLYCVVLMATCGVGFGQYQPRLGDAALKNTGTTAGTVAAGDDSRIVAGGTALQPAGDGSSLTGLTWSQIGSTPTTLSGYGITDAQSKVTFASPPATATSTGTQGTIIASGNYLYICIATDTWLRAQLLTW